MNHTATHDALSDNALEALAAGPLNVLEGGAAAPDAAPPAADADIDFLQFYGLKSNPFADSVNPAFFFRTERHEEACVRLMLAVRNDLSFGLVTGPSGSGKTLISQMVLTQLDDPRYRPVLVLVSPGMGKTALLKEMLNEMSIPLPEGPFVSAQDLFNRLGEAVMECHRQGRKPVFIVDECHFLSAESLHMIRTISNIELPEKKLTTCLLFGEARFAKRLEHPSYDSLRSRVYMRTELAPLSAQECEQYVNYRVLVAGRMEELFRPSALGLVHAHAGGICRNINKLCMLATLEAFTQRTPQVDDAHVERVAAMM
jgi:general secretion pathway protein A